MASKKKLWNLPAEIHGGKSKPNKAGSSRPDVKPPDVPSHVRNSRYHYEDVPAYPKFSNTEDEMQFHVDRFLKMEAREALWRINNILVTDDNCEAHMKMGFGMLWIRIAERNNLRDLVHRGYALLDMGIKSMTPKFKKETAHVMPQFQQMITQWKTNAKIPPGFDPYDDESWFKLLPKNPPMDFLAYDFLGDEGQPNTEDDDDDDCGLDPRTRALGHLKAGRREFALILFQISLKQAKEDNDDALIRENMVSIIPLLISSYRKEEAELLINEAIEFAEKLGDAEFLAFAKRFQARI